MIFIDTGPFLARHIQRDQYYGHARKAWREIHKGGYRCFTSNFILDETFTLLGRRTSYAFAAECAHSLLSSQALDILRPTHRDEIAALILFEKYSDQKVSFTDCVSFALMKKHNLKHVFTYDHHFERPGFMLWPSPADWHS